MGNRLSTPFFAHNVECVDKDLIGVNLAEMAKPAKIAVGRQIGITKGVDTLWRFRLADSDYLSRPFPRSDAE